MKNFFKSIRASVLGTAIASVILGFVMLIYPNTSMEIVCRLVGGIILLTGCCFVAAYVFGKEKKLFLKLGLVVGVLLLIVGGFIVLFPGKVVAIVPVVFGVLLISHGIVNLKQAWELRLYDDEKWWIPAAIAASIVVLGIIIMNNPFGSMDLMMKFLSVFLIYDGLSSTILVGRFAQTIKKHPKLIEGNESKIGELDIIDR